MSYKRFLVPLLIVVLLFISAFYLSNRLASRKIDEINLIFIKYYHVDKKDVITFYRNIGLAGYLKTKIKALPKKQRLLKL